MTSKPGYQTIAIHILPNNSRGLRNQGMKFGQLIEYNMRKTFVQKQTQEVLEKLFLEPYLKNQN